MDSKFHHSRPIRRRLSTHWFGWFCLSERPRFRLFAECFLRVSSSVPAEEMKSFTIIGRRWRRIGQIILLCLSNPWWPPSVKSDTKNYQLMGFCVLLFLRKWFSVSHCWKLLCSSTQSIETLLFLNICVVSIFLQTSTPIVDLCQWCSFLNLNLILICIF